MGSRPCEQGSKNTVEMIGGILVHGHGVCMRLCTKMVLLKGMLNGKRERAGERRAAPTGITLRRERRDEAAGALSRVLGARTGAGRRLASSESESLSLAVREGGRSDGTRVGNGQQRTRLVASSMAVVAPASGSGQAVRGRGGTAARVAMRNAR